MADTGASAPQTGPSQAEPEVSALRASVPSATRRSHVGAFRRTQWKRSEHKRDPRCVYCGRETGIGSEYGELEATVDHVQPLAKNGLDREDNYALACKLCNSAKASGKFTEAKRRALLLKKVRKQL